MNSELTDYKRLITNLIKEIGKEGEIMIIEGGSIDKPTTIKHDRTSTLKNYLTGWKLLNEIFLETDDQPDIKQVRNSL